MERTPSFSMVGPSHYAMPRLTTQNGRLGLSEPTPRLLRLIAVVGLMPVQGSMVLRINSVTPPPQQPATSQFTYA